MRRPVWISETIFLLVLPAILLSTSLRAPLIAQSATPNKFQELLNRAEASSRLRQWSEASAYWSQVVEANPYVSSYWYRLGEARWSNRDWKGTIPALQKLIELGANPGFPPVRAAYQIARCYGRMGEKQKALEWLERSFAMGLARQRVIKNEDFKLLRDDPRFKALFGEDDTSKMSRVEGWRYDLDLFVSEIKRMHPNPYRKISREAFDSYVGKLHNEIPKLNDEQVAVGFMKLATLVGDGHTVISPTFQTAYGRNEIPIKYYMFAEGFFVISAAIKYKDMVGTQLIRIGGHTMEEVLSALEPVGSRDNAMGLKNGAPYSIRSPQLLYGLGLIPDPEKMSITLRDAEGKERTLTVTGEPRVPVNGVHLVDGVNLHGLTPGSLPLSMQPRGGNYWFEYMPQDKTVYFQFNQVLNENKESLAQFCDRLFKFINENEVEKLVIDLRNNNGGDGILNSALLDRLIQADKVNRPGKLFVIIGRKTFSAAGDLCVLLERHTRAIFVGEPTGSSLNAACEWNDVKLPYSKMSGSVATDANGTRDSRTWIAPRLYTPETFAAFRAKRDPAMEAILAYGSGH
jgi:tetratricopeptide (TPR) repeat protein